MAVYRVASAIDIQISTWDWHMNPIDCNPIAFAGLFLLPAKRAGW